jgi:hypothetical protein
MLLTVFLLFFLILAPAVNGTATDSSAAGALIGGILGGLLGTTTLDTTHTLSTAHAWR